MEASVENHTVLFERPVAHVLGLHIGLEGGHLFGDRRIGIKHAQGVEGFVQRGIALRIDRPGVGVEKTARGGDRNIAGGRHRADEQVAGVGTDEVVGREVQRVNVAGGSTGVEAKRLSRLHIQRRRVGADRGIDSSNASILRHQHDTAGGDIEIVSLRGINRRGQDVAAGRDRHRAAGIRSGRADRDGLGGRAAVDNQIHIARSGLDREGRGGDRQRLPDLSDAMSRKEGDISGDNRLDPGNRLDRPGEDRRGGGLDGLPQENRAERIDPNAGRGRAGERKTDREIGADGFR